MIAKKHRFHGHNSVSRVRGARASGQYFTVFYSNNKKNDFRMAIVVSKKISKSAVTRNRIRRRLFESVRTQKLLDGQQVDTVFVVHTEDLATINADEITKQVAKACEKIVSRR